MKIQHSDLYCEFITFWFKTEIDDKLTYETFLDYSNMVWFTRTIEGNDKMVFSGNIEESSNEKAEEQRIRDLVTEYIKNT